MPELPDYIEHAVYKCYVFVDKSMLKPDWNRVCIMLEINALGVPCSAGTCPEVYLEKAFDKTNLRPPKRLPAAKVL